MLESINKKNSSYSNISMYSQFRTPHLHLTIQIPQAILTKEGTSSLLEGAPFLYLH